MDKPDNALGEKLMSLSASGVQALMIPILLLSVGGNLVAGIWLCCLGKWLILVQGIITILLSGWVLNLVSIPGLQLVRVGVDCERNGKTALGLVAGSGYLLYINILAVFWCVYVFKFFFWDTANIAKLPIYLWCFGMANAPWKYTPSRGMETVVDGMVTGLSLISLTAAQITALFLLVAHVFWNPNTLNSFFIAGSVMTLCFVIQMFFVRKYVPLKTVNQNSEILEAEIIHEDKPNSGNKSGVQSVGSDLAHLLPRVWFGFVLLAIYHSNENLMACMFFYHSLYRIHKVLQDATNSNYPLKPVKLVLMTGLLQVVVVSFWNSSMKVFMDNNSQFLAGAVTVLAFILLAVCFYWEFRWPKELAKYINRELPKKENVPAWLHVLINLAALFVIIFVNPLVGHLTAFANLFYLNRKLKAVLDTRPISTKITPALSKVG